MTEATQLLGTQKNLDDVLFPYLIGDELVGNFASQPKRYVIDFGSRTLLEAKKYKAVFDRVERLVLAEKKTKALEETERNNKAIAENPNAKINHHHTNFLKYWWRLAWRREELISKLANMSRFLACSHTTKRPIFEFVSARIHPNAKLQVFLFQDDYSFGILQSRFHWEWFIAKCTTLKGDPSYNSAAVFDTFPWPQAPTLAQAKQMAKAAVALRALRRKVMAENRWSLRDLYRTLDLPGKNPLRDLQDALDDAVRAAYGMKAKADPLAFLLDLNHQLAASEKAGTPIVGPGLPPCVKDPAEFITDDCVQPPAL